MNLNAFADVAYERLTTLVTSPPSRRVVRSLVDTIYLASLATEESRFTRATVMFADPRADQLLPLRVRAHYPAFHRFASPLTLSVSTLVKLSRAIDPWSSAILVYGSSPSKLVAWGVVDQLVKHNVSLHREGDGGFPSPGLFVVVTDAIGSLSAYRDRLLLARLRAGVVTLSEVNALSSWPVARRVLPFLQPAARAIAGFFRSVRLADVTRDTSRRRRTPVVMIHPNFGGEDLRVASVQRYLYWEWQDTVARLCIGLRRLGTGGSMLITPDPRIELLSGGYPLSYRRLGEAFLLHWLDKRYFLEVERKRIQEEQGDTAAAVARAWRLAHLAACERDDREEEVTGAVKMVTSLAAVDGLLLLTPELFVRGFGVKIGGPRLPTVPRVYDGRSFASAGTFRNLRAFDVSKFGTRHSSMLRYCRADPAAVGVVVSQDGQVRVIHSHGRRLILWDGIKLLDYDAYTATSAREERKRLARRLRLWAGKTRKRWPDDTPKTLAELLNWKAKPLGSVVTRGV
jgi:hypothetical protein